MASNFDALRKIQEAVGQNTAAMKKQPGLNLKLDLEQKSSAMATVQQSPSHGSHQRHHLNP